MRKQIHEGYKMTDLEVRDEATAHKWKDGCTAGRALPRRSVKQCCQRLEPTWWQRYIDDCRGSGCGVSGCGVCSDGGDPQQHDVRVQHWIVHPTGSFARAAL